MRFIMKNEVPLCNHESSIRLRASFAITNGRTRSSMSVSSVVCLFTCKAVRICVKAFQPLPNQGDGDATYQRRGRKLRFQPNDVYLHGCWMVQCAVSTAAMDDMERRSEVPPKKREAQFLRLRDRIEDCAARKSIEDFVQAGDPNILLLSEDFFR